MLTIPSEIAEIAIENNLYPQIKNLMTAGKGGASLIDLYTYLSNSINEIYKEKLLKLSDRDRVEFITSEIDLILNSLRSK
jgi:hypothetical protein